MEKELYLNQSGLNSLEAVMNRFNEVPFPQFKQELDDWFHNNLSAMPDELKQLQMEGEESYEDKLKKMVDAIYEQAEIALFFAQQSKKERL